MWIIHYRDPSLGAVVIIVTEAERVANLVRGKLPDARQSSLIQDVGLFVTSHIRRQQAFEDQIILAVPQRAERDGGLHDFAGTWIGDAGPRAPAAGRAMHPVDHVVADVHRIGAVGKHGDAKGVAKSSGFEGLVTPARAFDPRLFY